MFESAHNLEGNGAVLPFGEGRPERRALSSPAHCSSAAEYGLPFERETPSAERCTRGTWVAAAEERARRAAAIAHALERWGARAALLRRVFRPPGGRPFF